MKELNLSKLASTKLEQKEMAAIQGGQVTCSAKCGTDYNAGATKLIHDAREKNPPPPTNQPTPQPTDPDKLKSDTIANDSIIGTGPLQPQN